MLFLLLSLLRLQRLSLVDVLVLVRLLKGHRTLLLLLLEDVLGAGPRPSVDHVRPILPRVSRKLLPPAPTIQSFCQTNIYERSSPLDNEDTGIADLSSPVLCKLEAVGAVILVLPTVREPGAVLRSTCQTRMTMILFANRERQEHNLFVACATHTERPLEFASRHHCPHHQNAK